MRNIPLFSGLMVLLLYLAITLLGWVSLRLLYRDRKHFRWFSYVCFSWASLITVSFTGLFIYPFSAATATFYPVYFIFNSLLISDIFIKIPSATAAILSFFLKSRYRYHMALSGMIFSLGIGLSLLWGFTFGARSLTEKRAEISYSNLPDSFDGYRIAVISDLHLGNFHYPGLLARATSAIHAFSPDLLLFTGDLVNNFAGETAGWEEPFGRIHARDGKFAIMGNHDYGDYYRWPDASSKQANLMGILEGFRKLGFELLLNESRAIHRGADSIFVTGVENWGHPPFPQYADLEKASAHIPEGAFRILMTHDPAHWDSVVRHLPEYHLTFAGHSHGMQWGIKPAGIEFSLIYLSRKTWGGLYRSGENHLFVNRGLGTIGIPLRLDMPAEITFVTLRKK